MSIIQPSAKPRFRFSHQGEKMDAYRIDRFGSVDGVVLRGGFPKPGHAARALAR